MSNSDAAWLTPTQDNVAAVCRSPFHLLVPHVCSKEDSATDEPAASPPPKRPEAFPPRTPHPSKGSEASVSERQSTSRDRDTPPLAIGKGKRKGYSESSPPSKAPSSRETRSAAVARTPEPSTPTPGLSSIGHGEPSSTDRGPVSKRVRDDRSSAYDHIKVKPAGTRLQSAGEPLKSKSGGKSFPQPERGGGTWSEHRDAVCVSLLHSV